MKQTQERPVVTGVRVETRGDVPGGAAEYARAKVLKALGRVREPLPEARVGLSQAADPSVPYPAAARVSVDVNGHLVRAQAAADTMAEAIDLLQDRLAGRLARAHGKAHHRPHRGRGPRRRLPVEERRVVRRRTFGPPRRNPAEAVADMEALGHDFHLFTDVASGVDSVVYRDGRGGYRLARTARSLPGLLLLSASPSEAVVEVSGVPAPRMGLAQAMWRLEVTGLPFVFFTDAVTGRGNLLHHRRDGHYGLITPAG
ncbi:dormancy-associated translation inhibitor [Streptomyces glaucosporus]|uniref:Dormancy-associated translation inhibitor n=1 Tax=Streptomyces glaucosporus TaxID=284044 RepID=A0ABN3I0I6_9ACTN